MTREEIERLKPGTVIEVRDSARGIPWTRATVHSLNSSGTPVRIEGAIEGRNEVFVSWFYPHECRHLQAAPPDTKPRPDLIPAAALLEVGRVLAWGDARPGLNPERWRQQSATEHLASATRHILQHLCGRPTDPETQLPHLAHAGARVLYALAQHLNGK
jgi:hypothetical protein